MELIIIILFVIIIYLLLQLTRKRKTVTFYDNRPYYDPSYLWLYSWIPFYYGRNTYYSTYRPRRHHIRKNHKYKHPQRPVNTYKPVKKGKIIVKKIRKNNKN